LAVFIIFISISIHLRLCKIIHQEEGELLHHFFRRPAFGDDLGFGLAVLDDKDFHFQALSGGSMILQAASQRFSWRVKIKFNR